MNIYEVNLIMKSYVEIWSKSRTSLYVQVEQFLDCYPEETHAFFLQFFQSGIVTADAYFVFVCLFLFFSPSQIISICLANCRVYSNLIITTDQIDSMFQYFPKETKEKINVNSIITLSQSSSTPLLQQSHLSNTIPIKPFIDYLSASPVIHSLLYDFQTVLIKYTISLPVYYEMIQKHFYLYNQFRLNLPHPSESCCSKINRILFTTKPSPFHYDYCLSNPTTKSMDELIVFIKTKNGYSSRPQSSYELKSNSNSPTVIFDGSRKYKSYLSLSSPNYSSFLPPLDSSPNSINDTSNKNSLSRNQAKIHPIPKHIP